MKINQRIFAHKPVLHGGPFSIKHPNSKIIDFSSNISPIGISPHVLKTIKNQLIAIQNYPDPESIQLRKNLQNILKYPFLKL